MDRRDFIKRSSHLLLFGAGGATLAGCKTLDELAVVTDSLGGVIGSQAGSQAQSLLRMAGAASRAMEELDAEQEYYLGRTVAANVMTQYKAYNNNEANQYLNHIGRYVCLASALPETFGGYHFQIIDSDEINAFAAPGGLVMVTRGMLRCCQSEDALAAVLAHEVGHVEYRHGLQAIKRSRITSLMTTVGVEAIRHEGGAELSQLVSIFDGAIDDIMTTMVNNGYSRSFEREADRAALKILQRTGYDDRALLAMLEEMGRRLTPGGTDFAKTHPTPDSRIAEAERLLSTTRRPTTSARQARFERAMRNV